MLAAVRFRLAAAVFTGGDELVTVLDWVSQEYIPQLLDGFLNPQKRVSLIYLAVAAAITIGWSLFMSGGVARKAIDHARRGLFGRHLWMSRSAHGDYKLLLANHAVLLLIAPFFVSRMAVATALFFFLTEYLPAGTAILASASPLAVAIAYTAFLFVASGMPSERSERVLTS